MQLKFLSPKLREKITRDLDAAHGLFVRATTGALENLHSQNYLAAFECQGKALESARVIVTCHNFRSYIDLQRYTDAAIVMQQILLLNGMPQLMSSFRGKFIADLQVLLTTANKASDACYFLQQFADAVAFDRDLLLATVAGYAVSSTTTTLQLH